MDNTTTATAPQQTQPVDPTKAYLLALQDSFAKLQDTQLVSPDENEAKVKAALKEAKKLLKALRKEAEPEEPVVPPEETDTNSVKVVNANITPDQQRQIDLATEQFKQSVTRVDNQILAQYIQAIQSGDYAQAEAILDKAEQSQQTHTLEFALLTIAAILLPLYAKQRLQALFVHFGLHAVFAQTDSGTKAMQQQAKQGAASHVQTIAKDLKKSLDTAIDSQITEPAVEAAIKDKFEAVSKLDGEKFVKAVKKDQDIYDYAREQVLSGASRDAVIKGIQENFSEVGKRRATVIAGNEANRVFTMSQFDADSQFLAQNKLTTKAYKRLVSNTGTPEAVCAAIIAETALNPIPFKNDFIPFGKTFTGKGDNGKKFSFKPTYEHLKSGHIHVNCHCRYELLIKQDDGTFINTFDWKVENHVHIDFEELLHPRDKDGKFAKKGTTGDSELDVSKLGTKEAFDNFVDDSKKTYTKAQQFTADRYQSPHGYAINNAFRENSAVIKMNSDRISTQKFAEVFDTDFDMNIPNESTLYRGVGDSPSDFIVGKNYQDRGYTSTSSVEATARGKFKGPGGSVIHLTVPAGTKVAVPDLVSGKTSLDEQEVLLPRGSSYSVYKIEGDVVYAVAV